MEKGISPKSTLIVLLGASAWPEAPQLASSKAFTNSADKIREYFIGVLKIEEGNLLDLFDSEESQESILRSIAAFIDSKQANFPGVFEPKDIIVYFTGHGGFEGANSDYYLAIRHSTKDNFRASAIHIGALAHTLKTHAPFLRTLIILDACFASSAMPAFQSNVQQVAVQKARDAFYEQGFPEKDSFPERGTTLICSSSASVPSKINDDETYTMFSEGLIQALYHGNKKARKLLTITEIARFIWDHLSRVYKDEAVRPEVHSPNQIEGDIAAIPYFPNGAYSERGPGVKRIEALPGTLQCCIFISESEEKSKRLESVVTGMLISYKSELLKASAKSNIQDTPFVIKVSEAFSSAEYYRDVIAALCRADISIFDVTNYEPAIMFFMGVRSVVRRGITVATAGADYVIGDFVDFPFNIKDVNIISHSAKQLQIRDPINIMGERITEGFRQLAQMPDYLDLPAFDAVRKFPLSGGNRKYLDYSEQVLLLCSFSDEYQKNNWMEDFKRFLPIYIKDSIRTLQNIELPPNKPEIIRTLDIKTPRLVSHSLYEAIRMTNMCVVDWTGWKPNVFFELGIRVSVNDIRPVCVIEEKYKNVRENPTFKKFPLQLDGLLEWFNPIGYIATTEETANDSNAFKRMIKFHEESRLQRSAQESIAVFAETDATYEIISDLIDSGSEMAARPVYLDLANAANLMNSLEIDTDGMSPVLYPKNNKLVEQAEHGALERRIAAWLYIHNRYSFEQIVSDPKLKYIYSSLNNAILRSLLNSNKESDMSLLESVKKVRSQLKSIR